MYLAKKARSCPNAIHGFDKLEKLFDSITNADK